MNDTKQFGIFVGLYNRTTGNKLSVKNALKNNDLVALYDSVATLLKGNTETNVCQDSTQLRSLNMVNLSDKRKQVYDFIAGNPGLSRKQIAQKTGLLLQSICGRVNELVELDLIYVSGETFDTDTDRYVETLKVTE